MGLLSNANASAFICVRLASFRGALRTTSLSRCRIAQACHVMAGPCLLD